MKNEDYLLEIPFLVVLLVVFGLLLTGCYSRLKEQHWYLEYGQTGYIHTPTTLKNTWHTTEIRAPKWEDVK